MSEQGSAKTKPLSRRDFLKLLSAGGVAIAFAPFVPWGQFTPNPQNDNLQKAKVILPDGTHANLNTFPVNYAEIVTYPKTDDRVLDEEAFRKWQLIRLPENLLAIGWPSILLMYLYMVCFDTPIIFPTSATDNGYGLLPVP